MAELRCPMCGKANPEELDVCQFCQARLKPVLPSAPIPEDEQAAVEGSSRLPEPAAQDDSLSDWLNFLRDSGAESEGPPAESGGEDQPPPAGELPQWLERTGGEASEPVGEGDSQDWLDSLRKRGEEITGPLGQETVPEESMDEDWPASVKLPDQDYVPEWLAGASLGDQAGEPLAEPPSEEESSLESDDEPDWLQKIRLRQRDETEESQSVESAPAEEPGMPDWLGEPASGVPAAPDEPAESVSDWLADLRSGGAPVGEEVELPEAPATGEELPAAEQELEQPLEETPAPPPEILEEAAAPVLGAAEEIPTAPQISDEEIPDWLAGLVAGKAAAAAAGSVEADAESLPDWLADLDKPSDADSGVIVPFGEEEPGLTFDWLQEQVRADQGLAVPPPESSEAEEVQAEKITPFVGDLSDFLEEEYLSTPEGERPPAAQPEEGLTPAELPNWLEAMRPLDAAAMSAAVLDEGESQIESSGPLAGLRGILPAEPDVARLKKPPTYAMRLQVSESQQANANLLDELVKTEGQPRAVRMGAAITSQHVWRLIIFVVLIGVIIWKALTGSQEVALPQPLPEILDTGSVIGALPSNSVVLLAVDYEPGFSGEMKATSAAVIDHLMLKGAYFALVSTSPAGVGLAEQLIQDASALGGHQYQVIDRYANLGYIPGGPMGVVGFANAPRKMTPFALDVDSTAVWSREPLQRVTRLADFDLVAVLTEDADTARVWIEQVQPALDSTPLVMLLSAQAEPMVRPYYQSSSNQVQGMVAGLLGGGSYESAHQDLLAGDGPARRYWDAFSLSMLAAVILIALGGLVSLLTQALASRDTSEGEKKS